MQVFCGSKVGVEDVGNSSSCSVPSAQRSMQKSQVLVGAGCFGVSDVGARCSVTVATAAEGATQQTVA